MLIGFCLTAKIEFFNYAKDSFGAFYVCFSQHGLKRLV